MRAFVFTDPALTSLAGQFVWLAIDTEKSKNAPVRKKFPVPALPTFFVVDPADESVVLRWTGGATVAQLRQMLADSRLAYERRGPEQDQARARADRLYGEGNYAEAATAYREALAKAPADWPQYSRAIESLLFALQQVDDNAACARLAHDAYPRLRGTASAANVAASGLSCALGLPREDSLRATLVEEMEAHSREVLADTKLVVAADDRSGVYGTLLDARTDAGDTTGAKRVAGEWAAFLEGEAARAKSPEQRMVFDSHRLAAYLEMGEPEKALPMLEASRRDAPDDYNPPARLAIAYKAMKRWDEALAASDRALERVYGPRKLQILRTRAEIYEGRRDPASARRTLEEAVRFAEALPEGQRSEASIASLKKKLGAIQ